MDWNTIKNALAVGADAFRTYEQYHSTKAEPDVDKAKKNGDLASTLEDALGVIQEAETAAASGSFPSLLGAGINALVAAGQNGPDHGARTQISNAVVELRGLLQQHPEPAKAEKPAVAEAAAEDKPASTDAPAGEDTTVGAED